MPKLTLTTPALIRCLRTAARHGVNPYDSNTVQAPIFKKAWNDKARCSRSESDANRYLGA
jgi:hypothetical protein